MERWMEADGFIPVSVLVRSQGSRVLGCVTVTWIVQ